MSIPTSSTRATFTYRYSAAFILLLTGACSGDPASSGPTGGAAGVPASGTGGAAGAAGMGGVLGNPGGSSGYGGSAGVGGGASAGTGNAPGPFAAVAGVLKQNCGAAACHGGGPEAQEIVLGNMATLRATLTTTIVKECGNKLLVVPNDPANSALLMLPTWKCTDFTMPQGCIDDPCIPAADLATITAWISAGAPP